MRDKDLRRLTGIYQVSVNDCKYVGSTEANFSTRKRNHNSLLRLNKHHSPLLQREYNREGPESAEFSPLVIMDDVSLMRKWESALINSGAFVANSAHNGRAHLFVNVV